ncbi:MAG: CapA family protein [Roseburia inulinivorans]
MQRKKKQIMEVNGKIWIYRCIAWHRSLIEDRECRAECLLCHDATTLIEVIKEAKQTCDFVTVFPHWGTEYSEQPNAVQRELAKQCMDAGADSLSERKHTHCLKRIEYIDGKPVFYSLGNFIFGQNIDRSAARKLAVIEDGTFLMR